MNTNLPLLTQGFINKEIGENDYWLGKLWFLIKKIKANWG